MNNTIKILNQFMERYIEEEIPKYNPNLMKKEIQPGNIWNKYSLDPHPEAWENVDYWEQKFEKDYHAGALKQISEPGKVFVRRILLGYVACSRAANDGYDSFKQLMDANMHVLTLELEKVKGYRYTEYTMGEAYITFQKHGKNKKYVVDLETCAAFEIQAYSNCVKNFDIYKGK